MWRQKAGARISIPGVVVPLKSQYKIEFGLRMRRRPVERALVLQKVAKVWAMSDLR